MRVRLENGVVINTDDIKEVKIGKCGKNCAAFEVWLFMNDGSKFKAATEYTRQNAALRANFFKPNSFILEVNL